MCVPFQRAVSGSLRYLSTNSFKGLTHHRLSIVLHLVKYIYLMFMEHNEVLQPILQIQKVRLIRI